MAFFFGGSYANDWAVVTALMAVALLVSPALGDGRRGGETAKGSQHVVGDDRGWDASSDVAAWAVDRIFRAGDNLWFAYSGDEGGILELESRKAFESCDLSRPVRMYSSGLDKVRLDAEGSRFFASGERDKCRNGLKLHVEVSPAMSADKGGNWQQQTLKKTTAGGGGRYYQAMAAGPTSSAAHQRVKKAYATGILLAVMALPIWL